MARVIDPADYMLQILAELNIPTDPILEAIFPFYWETNADKGTDLVRYLYCKRNVIDYLMGRDDIRHAADITQDSVKIAYSQAIGSLQSIRDNVTAEIKRYSGALSVSVPVATLTNPYIRTTSGEFG